ncbi:uncharacterized protein LOC102700249 isoform X1 [Oryza brachyantha]|uniref:uncharacterized protein LOC102700249 isoform X1 n=1 Tax=Oryza brachyantha TaxID=4533 RepID=UPI0003EAA91E|nr:uncharacterized protein LOC102700249 isoform X1 [Oryza brachyantha]XP_040381567.1 uncharacterized protein LOC102700249 isoform X1 [Oryza brachyantha]XP_040381568.1 uncharacterized protein LOC102700249 isoform X1 [Oryza brachyantha]XP_040381569.1 uncharacterized protein LOC102700249 isoform X1 [Oryza brachyantha]XP_040381570.1 uncharacterized protein LOC102700249 isoform X1 [Oryza brachyantha]XP_040381571.1 uncharacterized protein LOC102700249 isoform X1 [Oryza brachyantha]XP_040381572.1 un
MLLMVVRGAKCFEDIRTYEGKLYDTYREACQARGLIGDDTEWVHLFDEAIVWATSYQLRNMFMTVVVYCDDGNIAELYDRYWTYMADDIAYKLLHALGPQLGTISDELLQGTLLKELDSLFSSNGLSMSSYSLPQLPPTADSTNTNRLLLQELCYNRIELSHRAHQMYRDLNQDQRQIFDKVLDAISANRKCVYFVSGHGGTGKTFLWDAIITRIRSQGQIVLAVASSGVAALLLPGGCTAHSRFRIPLDINDRSLCHIKRGTILAELIMKTSLIIWDEAPMTHRFCFEALDRTLRDISCMENPANEGKPFGGKPILFGGDFRQVLPVIEGGTRADIVSASLIKLPLWRHVEVMHLTVNMRLSNPSLSEADKEEFSTFAQWVLSIGEGHIPAQRRPGEIDCFWIDLPPDLLLSPTGDKVAAIIDEIYPDFHLNYASEAYLAERAIVCPVNTIVDEINSRILDQVPQPARSYLSYDLIANSSEQPMILIFCIPLSFLIPLPSIISLDIICPSS